MSSSEKKGSGLLISGAALCITGAVLVIISGYGYQWGWWHFSLGFKLIPWGTGGTILGGILAAAGFYRLKERTRWDSTLATVSITLAIAAIINIAYWANEVNKGYPPIHDITTDTANPPKFEVIAPLRKGAPNPVEYAGEETAKIQKEFYPDIEPLLLNIEYDEAYDRALRAARKMPWTLVGENREDGLIEAYEKVAWFGFIDDVVIRVDSTETGTKIDVRSKSRIGRGDLGVNAKRIQAYFKKY